MLALRSVLARRGIRSCATLAAAWQAEPKALLRELAALLPEAGRVALIELWPKLLVLAERASGPSGGGRAKRGRKRSR